MKAPPVTGFVYELCHRFDTNPDDQLFERLKKQGISVFVATRGMRGDPVGKDDIEMAGLGHGKICPVKQGDPRVPMVAPLVHGEVQEMTLDEYNKRFRKAAP